MAYKIKGTVGSTHNIKTRSFIFRQGRRSKSYFNVSRSDIVARLHSAFDRPSFANNKQETVKARKSYASVHSNRRIGGAPIVWLRKQTRRHYTYRIFFHKLICVESVFRFLEITLKRSKSVYISAMRRKKEKSTNPIVISNVCSVTTSLSKGKIGVVRHTFIPLRSESFLLVVSTMAGHNLSSQNLKCGAKNKTLSPKA